MPLAFIHPSTILIAGPSGCGKTLFLIKLIRQRLIVPQPMRIVLVYSEYQKIYEKLTHDFPAMELIKGPLHPDLYDSFQPDEENLLILDDQMTDASNSSQLSKYFVQGSHHRNLTVIFIIQNIFEKGKAMKTTNLNTHYLVLFKNPRDKGQFSILARQMYPVKWKAFLAAFEDATRDPYSYLLVDLRPETPEEYRIRASILSDDPDAPTKVYII